MSQDIVSMMQHGIITVEQLYKYSVKKFDEGETDLKTFFSELSRISAIAVFSHLPDQGITSEFTQVTFSKINSYRNNVSNPFHLSDLLESNINSQDIIKPGFLSLPDGCLPFASSDADSKTSSLLNESAIIDNNLIPENDFSKKLEHTVLSEDHYNKSTTANVVITLLGRNDCQLAETIVDIQSDKINSSRQLVETATQNETDCLASPAKMSSSSVVNKATISSDELKTNDISLLCNFGNNNANEQFPYSSENHRDIMVNYAFKRAKIRDPYEPDDYYAIPDLQHELLDQYKDISIHNGFQVTTHIPLNKKWKVYNELAKLVLQPVIEHVSEISYVSKGPIVFTTYTKLSESKDFQTVYFDAFTSCSQFKESNVEFISSYNFVAYQQHIRTLYLNFAKYCDKKHKIHFRFSNEFTELVTFASSNSNNKDYLKYPYNRVIVFTTYHSVIFKKIIGTIITTYAKLVNNANTSSTTN